jgi:chloride channel protein, CIC family
MLSATSAAATRLRVLVTRMLHSLGFGDDAFLLLVAAVVGVVTSAAAVGFHHLIDSIRELLYHRPGPDFLYGGPGIALIVVWPALGGLIVGIISHHLVRDREGRGVVDVMESVVRSSGFIKPSAAIEKIFTSAITIGSGGSGGAEGPILQIGAAVASGIGRLFRLARSHMPVIVGCGTAAGISAIFNSPLGGLLFTLEVILHDFSLRTVTPVVVASVIANVTTRAIFHWLGDPAGTAIFQLPPTDFLVTWQQLGNFVMLGIACGLVGVLFTRLMYFSEKRLGRMRLPAALRPAAGGAMLGVMGMFYIVIFGWFGPQDGPKPIDAVIYPMPAFFGDGYGFIQLLLGPIFYGSWTVNYLLALLAFLCVAKILGTCLTIGSGGSGGIIAPSLFLGAVIGGLLGLLLRQTGIFEGIRPEVYALVGMGAALAAVVHAPLASILILLDVTQDFNLALPVMLAAVIATGVARRIMPDSIYTISLRDRGVHISGSGEQVLLRRLHVEQVNLEPAVVVQPSDPFQRVLDLMSQMGSSTFIVIDKQGYYVGMITDDDVNTALMQREAVPLLLVSELMRTDVPFVRNTDDLASVLDVFSRHDVDHLPVCLAQSPGKVIGLISRAGLMRHYQEQLLRGRKCSHEQSSHDNFPAAEASAAAGAAHRQRRPAAEREPEMLAGTGPHGGPAQARHCGGRIRSCSRAPLQARRATRLHRVAA